MNCNLRIRRVIVGLEVVKSDASSVAHVALPASDGFKRTRLLSWAPSKR